MKKYWKLILQLHAEGEAPAAAAPASATPAPAATSAPAAASSPDPATTVQQSTPAVPTTPEPAPKPAPAEPDYKVLADTGGGTQLVMDANGQKRIITVDPKIEPEPAPAVTDNQQQQNANAQQAEPAHDTETEPSTPASVPQPLTKPYTLEELTLAIQLGQVDESRIPPAYAIQYGQFKEKQAQQQAIAQAQQQAQQVPQPNEAQQRIAFMEEIEKVARELTMKQLGLTEEDLSDSAYADYSDNPDLGKRVKAFEGLNAYNRQQIINDVQAKQSKAQAEADARAAVVQSINDFTNHEMQTEPKFAEINKELLTYYQTLPYSEAVRYAEAVAAYQQNNPTEQSVKVLQEYYEKVKKMVYARSNNLSTTPTPVVRRPASVESPGTGQNIQKQANPEELRGLDYMGKIAWLAKHT